MSAPPSTPAAPSKSPAAAAQGAGGVATRVRTIAMTRADDSTSRQSVYADEFEAIISGSGTTSLILPTPYDVVQLYQLIARSSMLPQCIDAYVVNTVEAGWEVGPRSRNIEIDPIEADELQSFIDRANIEETLTGVMSKVIRDRESVGFGFLEVIRDRKGDISLLRHAPSISMRLTGKHPAEQLVKYDVVRGARTVVVKEYKRFRRFVQVISGRYTYFKEFGDPRDLDSVTGLFDGEAGYTSDSPATEIYHSRRPSNDPYGVPQWISQVPNMIGSREAEECNMRFFEDNTIPPAMITVAGGRLTATSYKEIQRVLTTGAGAERQNKMILIEAVGEGDSIDGKSSAITITVNKLTSERPSDGLFLTYDEGNQAKLRSAFRLPPVVVGMSQDATFATAQVSQYVAETQVFAPARQRDDDGLNNLIINGRNGLRLTTVKLVARTPAISSPEATVKTLTALNVIGAVTPRSAQTIANSMMQIELPEYPEKGAEGYEEWMDQPMPITIKQAGAAQGTGDPSAQSSHDGQAAKDAGIKATEQDGDTAMSAPEHGQE